jgi:hypothetical protein
MLMYVQLGSNRVLLFKVKITLCIARKHGKRHGLQD